MNFNERLNAAQSHHKSTLAVGLAPSLKTLPLAMQSHDDPFLPFGKSVIEATHELVCAYVFHLASYLALGAAGAVALERTIAFVPSNVLKILHGPFGSPDYAPAALEGAFNVDAVTLAPTTDAALIGPYLTDAKHGIYVEANEGFPVELLLKMNEDYPGQIGIYRRATPDHNTMGLLFEPFPDIQWYWGENIYTSQRDDYRDAIRQAVITRREDPPNERPKPSRDMVR
jgi:hypothetical protein